MSRFVPLLRETWLVCKRNGLSKDLRQHIVRMVKRKAFSAETRLLRKELTKRQRFMTGRHQMTMMFLRRDIRQGVEYFENQPWDPHEANLRLHKVCVRPTTTRGQFMWHWLYDN